LAPHALGQGQTATGLTSPYDAHVVLRRRAGGLFCLPPPDASRWGPGRSVVRVGYCKLRLPDHKPNIEQFLRGVPLLRLSNQRG